MRPWLEVTGLGVDFPKARGRRALAAVSDVDFTLARGETLGLVGESGSGKSTLARALVGLIPPTRGQVRLDGVDVTPGKGQDGARGRLQMVFQDAEGAMNPRLRVGAIVAEPLRWRGMGRSARAHEAETLLARVGLPRDLMTRFPREISGGQRQRVALARAMATAPELLILDEPTSGLDVSLQARTLNLLRALQEGSGLSYLLISHDLGSVAYLAARIAVMYLGRLVETAPTEALITSPRHPYTAALLAALPPLVRGAHGPVAAARPDKAAGAGPGGCAYQPHCPYAQARCHTHRPPLTPGRPAHAVACHYPLPPGGPGP